MQWPRQVSAAPRGGRSRVHPAPGPRLPWRLHEPLRPTGGGVAGLQAKRGCRGAARRPRGKEGGARQALVPAAPAGSAAARDAPPAPGLHACERLEKPARERTASASPAQRLGRRSPRSGDNCRVGWLGPPPPSPGPLLPPPSAASRGSFARRGEGAGRRPERGLGASAGGGGGEIRVRIAPPRRSRTLPHQHPLGGWMGGAHGEKSRLC